MSIMAALATAAVLWLLALLVTPYVKPLAWALVIGIATVPHYDRLTRIFSNHPNRSAGIMVLIIPNHTGLDPSCFSCKFITAPRPTLQITLRMGPFRIRGSASDITGIIASRGRAHLHLNRMPISIRQGISRSGINPRRISRRVCPYINGYR